MSSKFLSFNPSVKDGLNLDECIQEEKVPVDELPLQFTWHVWEQIQNDGGSRDYEDNTRDLANFDTVQKFWQLWAYLPQPSELLDHKRMVRQDKNGVTHVVDALMIFKAGVKPMWEDVLNQTGGHFEYKINPGQCCGGQLDEYWNNLVLGLIGGTIEGTEYVTGIRLVDKLSIPRHPCIRIEVWFRKADRSVQEALQKDLGKCMTSKIDGSTGIALRSDVKFHSRG